MQRNLARVQARLAAAAAEAPHSGPGPKLIAVTKSVDASITRALAALMPPPVELGESRAEGLDRKHAALQEAGLRPHWHFIGHIQRNKARRIIENADALHSIDSMRLARTVVRLSDELERSLVVFVEVNLTGETEKHGLSPGDAEAVVHELSSAEHLQVAGLMAMGPARGLRVVDDVFGDVAQLAAELHNAAPDAFMDRTCRLSMGMSGDLESAVRHGSSYVRVGSALFEGVQALHSSKSTDSSR